MQWYDIIYIIAILAILVAGTIYFMKTKSIKEWLVYAVVEAERILGGKTGQVKLKFVYDLALDKFPSLISLIPFSVFSKWVDMALDSMRSLIESNDEIAKYIGGE